MLTNSFDKVIVDSFDKLDCEIDKMIVDFAEIDQFDCAESEVAKFDCVKITKVFKIVETIVNIFCKFDCEIDKAIAILFCKFKLKITIDDRNLMNLSTFFAF